MQLIFTAATCIFSWAGVIATHKWYTSALPVYVQWGWISFETAVHCRELELYFFQQVTYKQGYVLFMETSKTYTHDWMLNKNESLSILKPHSYLCLTCLDN